MKISVIIPAYNCAQTLCNTIDSILKSGLEDYEIIIVDDGSKDRTADICDQLAAEYENIHCIHQINSGVSSARNRGITEARGDYLWFIDSDDTIRSMDDSKLKRLTESSYDMVAFGMAFHYFKNGKLVKEDILSSGEVIPIQNANLSDSFELLFDKNYFSSSCNKLISRELILKNELFFHPQLTNYEDLDYSLRILRHCKSFVALPDIWYDYHNESGKDHTVKRLSKIEHVVENTDIIAAAFFGVAEEYPADTVLQDQITAITLRIYLELCYQKLQTCTLPEIRTLCSDFQKNPYIAKCNNKLNEMAGTYQTIYAMLQEGNAKKIRGYMRYRKVRHAAGAAVRAVLGRR